MDTSIEVSHPATLEESTGRESGQLRLSWVGCLFVSITVLNSKENYGWSRGFRVRRPAKFQHSSGVSAHCRVRVGGAPGPSSSTKMQKMARHFLQGTLVQLTRQPYSHSPFRTGNGNVNRTVPHEGCRSRRGSWRLPNQGALPHTIRSH